MLKWHDDYYIGEGIQNAEEIRRKIDEGRSVPGIYLLTLSEQPDNLLEMIPSALLRQRWMRHLCPEIIGIARGKQGAMETAVRIIEEVYEKTGSFHVKDYMKNR